MIDNPADMHDAIINPKKGKKSPYPGKRIIMVSSEKDLSLLGVSLPVKYPPTTLMMSRIHLEQSAEPFYSLAGPVISSPYAVMLAEALIAWGAEQIIFLGWCGAISPDQKIGDLIIPNGAIIDEGTSLHYGGIRSGISRPCPNLCHEIKAALNHRHQIYHEGLVWTTDAVYRETPEKISYFQSRNALAVEMELSALFTLGAFRRFQVASLLVVSDELSSQKWKPGFKDPRFSNTRTRIVEVISDLCRSPA